jgi:hypothetical protein
MKKIMRFSTGACGLLGLFFCFLGAKSQINIAQSISHSHNGSKLAHLSSFAAHAEYVGTALVLISAISALVLAIVSKVLKIKLD